MSRRLGAILMLLVLCEFPAGQAFAVSSGSPGYTISILTGQPQYQGSASITINGTILPAPEVQSSVTIFISSPFSTGAIDETTAPVNLATGNYAATIVVGCPYTDWSSGNYVATGVWASSQGAASSSVGFAYVNPTTSTCPVTTTSSAGVPPEYALAVQTNSSSYSGSTTIRVSGVVSPVPKVPSNVTVLIVGPENTELVTSTGAVSTSSGQFSAAVATGCAQAGWQTGTYSLIAVWALNGSVAFGATAFPFATNAASSGGSGSPGCSSSGTSPVPEFGGAALPLVLLACVGALLILERTGRGTSAGMGAAP